MGKIISVIEQNSFRISRMKMVKLEPEEVLYLFEERKNDPFI
jgi:nucleoside diphosphate kinase